MTGYVAGREPVKASVRALLEGLIDYAGLFPPAALGMEDAVANYATYRRGPFGWMLGRFIVPSTRLGEFEQAAASRVPSGAGAGPMAWRLSMLGSGDLVADAAAIESFNGTHEGARIDALETNYDPEAIVIDVPGVMLWFEVTPGPSLGAALWQIAAAGHGVKLRTGGVTPDLIPPTQAVAQVLFGCARTGVRMKATAGLHHPIRAPHRLTYADDSPTALMHGFINLFVAAAVARELVLHGYPDPEAQATIAAVLDEADPNAFEWDDDGVTWREHRVDASELTAMRQQSARSFGSCSFEEPIEDLRQLGLL
jgi:hypothetical protein